MKAALGGLLVAAHAAGFLALAAHGRGAELTVALRAPAAAPAPTFDAQLPPPLVDRVHQLDDGGGPGLHRRRWVARYRGGVERAVGAAQLVGPFQDPARRACVGRVVVGQRLLDDGRASPGTIAHAVGKALTTELSGTDVLGAGALQRIDELALRWATLDAHPDDRALIGEAPHGYVRVAATVVFARVRVPIVVALVPTPADGQLAFRIATRAALTFDSRVLQWLSDRLGADRLATRLASRQLDATLVTALAPPPPVPLPGGHALQFTYCDAPPEIADGAYGALPFAVAFAAAEHAPGVLPPRLGPPPRRAPPANTAVGLDLDLDGLNAVLYELWRVGELDRQLADAGLDRRFNADPLVAELLTLRLSPLALTLPPVVSASRGGLRLAAEARVEIRDGQAATSARIWGGLEFALAAQPLTAVPVSLGALELTCEARPGHDARAAGAITAPPAAPLRILAPCYSDLVAAVSGRTADFQGALSAGFARLLSSLFVGRFGARGLPGELAIRGVAASVETAGRHATLHLALDGAVTASP